MAPGELDLDSGVESLPVSSKDMTPEKPKALPELEDDDDEVRTQSYEHILDFIFHGTQLRLFLVSEIVVVSVLRLGA